MTLQRTAAEQLVARLATLGYVVHGVSFEIIRFHGQPMMNKAAGEAAPTWELLSNPLVHAMTRRIIAHGEYPDVRMPDGGVVRCNVCSHVPLSHILRQPLQEWIVSFDTYSLFPRLVIETEQLPPRWH